jgi:hypothetical protein
MQRSLELIGLSALLAAALLSPVLAVKVLVLIVGLLIGRELPSN